MKKKTAYEYEVEIANLKRALIAKDKEIERVKFGKITFYGLVTELNCHTDYYDDSSYGFEKSYMPILTTYTLEISITKLHTTPNDFKKLMNTSRLKFTAELDNES